MNTKELAVKLREYAAFLESRPEFSTDGCVLFSEELMSITYYNKDLFLTAAKAIGSATKSYSEGEYAQFLLTSTEIPFELRISRDKVCSKKVIYECEPLFSVAEVEAL